MLVFWIILGVLILFIIGFTIAVFLISFYNANDKDTTYAILTGEDYDPFQEGIKALIDEAVKLPYESVYVTSYDGLKLFGRLFLRKEGSPVHIEFHGYRGLGIKDFSGGMTLPLSLDHNVLLVDHRACGGSEGHVITYGIRERRDVLSWIGFVKERFGKDTPIYLEGISMGAATVLMASDLVTEEDVAGIWADCPYSDPFKINSLVASHMVKIPHFCDPFIILAGALFAHINIFSASPLKSVKNAKVPIRIIHGTADHFVPFEMSVEMEKANPDTVKLVPVEGAPHGLSFLKDKEGYRAAYYEFMRETEKR